jgi:hypothetical protein
MAGSPMIFQHSETRRMNRFRSSILPTCLLAATLVSGCAELPFFDVSPSGAHPRAEDVNGRAAIALREGVALYNEGEFNAAIRRLSSPDMASGSRAMRVKALKYTAFSYCVTSRAAQCRQAFDKALRLDPAFDLSPGEHGHPLWGPVFAAARKDR